MHFPINIPPQFLTLYLITNFISILLIIICAKWYRIGKYIFGLIFLISGFVNIYILIKHPESYFELGKTSILYFYRDFINVEFRDSEVIYVLFFSILHLFISFVLFSEGFFLRHGIKLGITFLIIIAPFGVGSAFPATLLMAIALMITNAKRIRKINERMQSHIL
jgi:hypothetical protein